MHSITRRKLLAGFLAIGATGTSNILNAITDNGTGSKKRHVLIIGAGLAGLYAARILEELGFSTQVIEARSRVGGRVYTLDDIPGHPEAGANGMGASYGRILDVAAKLNVPMRRQLRGLPSDYYIDETHLSSDEWKTWVGNSLPDDLRNLTPNRISGHFIKTPPFVAASDWRNSAYDQHDISATEFFRSKGLDEKAISLLNINNSYGNTLDDTSLLSLYRVRSTINRAISMRKPGWEASDGNIRIPEAMASSLSNPVIMQQKVTHINQSAGGIRVTSESGNDYEGDAAIIALPVPAVRNIRFTPLLSKEQHSAFQAIHYHKITQVHLIAKEPFWKKHGHKGSFWTNGPLGRVFTRQIPDTDLFNMLVWINGNDCDALDSLSEDVAKMKIMQTLTKIYPGATSSNLELKSLVQWHKEPLNQGAWAVWQPGQIGKFANLLHQADDRLFFAGEHTAYAYSGMEGAAESGERAALEVIRRLL